MTAAQTQPSTPGHPAHAVQPAAPGGASPVAGISPADIPALLARGQITTGLVAMVLRAELQGPSNLVITGFDGLDTGGPGTLTFIRDARFAHRWSSSRCGAALVSRGLAVEGHDPSSRALIIVPDADLAVITLLRLIAPQEPVVPGVHPSAIIDPSAKVDPSCGVGPGCIIGPGAVVGPNTLLAAGVVIGRDVSVGSRTRLGPHVTIGDRCKVGSGVTLHTGVVIGCDGFGYRPAPDGSGLVKIPHIGHVVIEDQVEIGANSCVDRGRFGATRIGAGSKIDNLVQIAHNCQIGQHVIICGCCGIAGSVTIGDFAVLGGSVGVADGVTIGPRARVAGKAAVMQDIPAGAEYAGMPAQPAREFFKHFAFVRKLFERRGERS